MPDNPFDKIDDFKHRREIQAAEAIHRKEANDKRDAAIDAAIKEFRRNQDIKLQETLKGFIPLFDEVLFEFGTKIWGFPNKIKWTEKFFFKREIEEPRFHISDMELYGSGFDNKIPYPAFRGGRAVRDSREPLGYYGYEHGFYGLYYFIAATTRNVTLTSVELGKVQSIGINESCIVGAYTHISGRGVRGNEEYEYFYEEDTLKGFLTAPIELNAIKHALADIYIKIIS